MSKAGADRLRPRCFNNNCEETYESVNEMVAVAGRGDRSPRHFCESCAERIRRGPPMTDGGTVEGEGEHTDKIQHCARCETDVSELSLPDGQAVAWYCGDCHAITTNDPHMAVWVDVQQGDGCE